MGVFFVFYILGGLPAVMSPRLRTPTAAPWRVMLPPVDLRKTRTLVRVKFKTSENSGFQNSCKAFRTL